MTTTQKLAERVHAARLRARREALDLTQLELAGLSGVRPETISRVERGQAKPRRATLQALEAALADAEARLRR